MQGTRLFICWLSVYGKLSPLIRRPCRPLLAMAIGIALIFETQMTFSLAQEPTPSAGLSYLALGDSYTIGESVAEDQRWPMQLAKQLAEMGIEVAHPDIIARTGWTTGELLDAIDSEKPQGDRQLVSLLIGVNNQYRGMEIDEYRVDFEKLLKLSIEYAQGKPERVLVLSIPDYGLTPFIAKRPERKPKQIAEQLDAFNAAAKEITLQHNAHFVDITSVSREYGADKEMLAEDGLHPSAAMYALWTKAALPVAAKILKAAQSDSNH